MRPVLTLLDTRADERSPMTEVETGTFVRCCQVDEKDAAQRAEQLAGHFASLGDMPAALGMLCWRIVWARKDVLIRPAVALFAASLCRSPGDVTLWAHLLVTESRGMGRAVTMADLAYLFPAGFPSEEGRMRIWDAQKAPEAPFGNRLDARESWGGA